MRETIDKMISNEKYNGVQKGSGALLHDLRNSKVQRELPREGACGPYLQDLRMSVTRKAGRTDDAPPPKILAKLMDYTDHPRDVADPWYTDDFEATWRDVLEGCQGLLDELTRDKA